MLIIPRSFLASKRSLSTIKLTQITQIDRSTIVSFCVTAEHLLFVQLSLQDWYLTYRLYYIILSCGYFTIQRAKYDREIQRYKGNNYDVVKYVDILLLHFKLF